MYQQEEEQEDNIVIDHWELGKEKWIFDVQLSLTNTNLYIYFVTVTIVIMLYHVLMEYGFIALILCAILALSLLCILDMV